MREVGFGHEKKRAELLRAAWGKSINRVALRQAQDLRQARSYFLASGDAAFFYYANELLYVEGLG